MRRRRTLLIPTLAVALSSIAAPVRAQFPGVGPRLTLSAWAGVLPDRNAGFASGTNDFFSFDRSFAFGGGLHARVTRSLFVGVDAARSAPGYTHFERNPPQVLNQGDAKMYSTVVSARLQGSPGRLGFYLTGGAGFVFFDVPELGDANRDNALTAGAGLEFLLRTRLSLFGEYDQWWIYHDKVDNIVKNTVSRAMLRFGTRLGFL